MSGLPGAVADRPTAELTPTPRGTDGPGAGPGGLHDRGRRRPSAGIPAHRRPSRERLRVLLGTGIGAWLPPKHPPRRGSAVYGGTVEHPFEDVWDRLDDREWSLLLEQRDTHPVAADVAAVLIRL